MREKILLIVASTLIALFFVETVLQTFWENPYEGSQPDKLLRLMVPHASVDLSFKRDEIDASGSVVRYRTNERSYLQPVNMNEEPDVTIGFLGGSTTECKAVQESKRFPYVVSQLFKEEGIKVRSLNVAVSGNTTQGSINVLFNHLVQERPNFVVLMHAVNDLGVLRRGGDYTVRMNQDVSAGLIGRLAVQLASAYSATLGLVRSVVTAPKFRGRRDREYPYVEVDSEPFRARLIIFVEMCKAFGITPVLMTQPLAVTVRNAMTPDWVEPLLQDEFNEVIRSVGLETGTKVIDLATFVARESEENVELRELFYDGVHVTDQGSLLYGELIHRELGPLIRSAKSSKAIK